MAQQNAVFCRLGDAIMDAGQSAGDRADHAAIAECSHEVFVKKVKLGLVHTRGLTFACAFRRESKLPYGIYRTCHLPSVNYQLQISNALETNKPLNLWTNHRLLQPQRQPTPIPAKTLSW